jgi:ABC-type nitrate/sulfonate/bicarbonate transport system permease component
MFSVLATIGILGFLADAVIRVLGRTVLRRYTEYQSGL